MQDLVLTCRVCGHAEYTKIERALMAKVRLYNHVVREHPALADRFREISTESPETPDTLLQSRRYARR